MIKIKSQGRTGNILLQNIGASILSRKYDLKVEKYFHLNNENILGVKYFKGGKIKENLKKIYDTWDHMIHLQKDLGVNISDSLDLSKLIEESEISYGLDLDCTFQVSQFIKKYRKEILEHFDLNFDLVSNSLFVHVRLGDVASVNPGFEYYKKAIQKINFETGFISSDSFSHPIVQNLILEFGLQPYTEDDPIKILNFAKNFENLVLSKGTFSWWMAMLSKGKEIIFPKNDTAWYGDIFVFDDWKFIEIK